MSVGGGGDLKSLCSVTTANSDDILYKNVSPIFKNGIIITPYYSNGDVKTYCENFNYLLSDDLVFQWCHQLSSSVAYLASVPIVHRDIAARNCLLDDELNLKLCDFGMAELLDPKRKNPEFNFAKNENDKVAIPWSAPECLKNLTASPKSDVWSMGVTMWEFLMRCQKFPHEELSKEENFQRKLVDILDSKKEEYCHKEVKKSKGKKKVDTE